MRRAPTIVADAARQRDVLADARRSPTRASSAGVGADEIPRRPVSRCRAIASVHEHVVTRREHRVDRDDGPDQHRQREQQRHRDAAMRRPRRRDERVVAFDRTFGLGFDELHGEYAGGGAEPAHELVA